VGPIGLRLLAGEGVKAEKGFAARRAQFGDDATTRRSWLTLPV